MHGIGNDFAIFDQRFIDAKDFTDTQLKQIADRRTGIGCDQIIILRQSSIANCNVLIFNQDGSPSGACGNASRCIAKIIGSPQSTIQIGDRILQTKIDGELVEVDMGVISFKWESIPVSHKSNALNLQLNHPIFKEGACANIGNPHLILIVNNLDQTNIADYGPYFENHPLFPQKVNVNFAQIIDKQNIKLKVWERGVGETLACGSGACATAAVLCKKQLVDSKVNVTLPGGTLTIKCDLPKHVFMSGPATLVYKGEIYI